MKEKNCRPSIEHAMQIIERMKNSTSMEYMHQNVKINKQLTLKINCIRSDLKEIFGRALYFEIYAIVNKSSEGYVTVYPSNDIRKEINCFIDCWI